LKSNKLQAAGGKALGEGLKGNQVITELNIADNNLGSYTPGVGTDMSGVIALADAIPDMRALSIANVMGNKIGKEMLSKLREIMHSKPNLISLCGLADDATEADLSGLGMDADDAIILASELPDKGAMTSLNLANNNLGELVIPITIPAGWEEGKNKGDDRRIFRKPGGKWAFDGPPKVPLGAIAFANAISDMGALTSLDLANNNIGHLVLPNPLPDGWEVHSGGDHYKHKDGSWGGADTVPGAKPLGAIAIASAIPDMGALLSANLLGNYISVEQAQELAKIMQAKENLTTLCGLSREETELDFSGQKLGAGDAVLIANDISNMRAISSVNVLFNDIGAEQAHALANILKEHATLKSLCGNKGNETQLDMSGKKIGADGAIMLAPEIADNEAISQFTFSGDRSDSKPITMETSMTEADFSGKGLGLSGAIMLSAFLPKCT
jgi:Ran GTPase-activating protein (RanGAP) involved in mRNA processing and transport